MCNARAWPNSVSVLLQGRSMVPEPLDLQLASDLEFPAQAGGQLAFSPPSNSSPSPFMQFAASMANQGKRSDKKIMTLIQIGSENVFFCEKCELPLHTQAALQVSRLEN